MSVILAVESGLGSSVGIFRDGFPVFCIEEERLTRVKNWMGIPKNSIEYILDNDLISVDEVDFIGLTDLTWIGTTRETFYRGYNGHLRRATARRIFGKPITTARDRLKYVLRDYPSLHLAYRRVARHTEAVENFLVKRGFPREKMERIEHHYCHATAAYYGLADNLEDEYLVFTLDGGGDCHTSGLWKAKDGSVEKLSDSGCYSIGNIYSALTLFLGFVPHEHEYKLMGLAPYVREKYSKKYKEYFARFLDLREDDTKFFNPRLIDHEGFLRVLRKDLVGERFDSIAAGLQAFTEEIVIRWVRGSIKKYGIRKLLCAGGVFMNVKLNMLLAQLPEVDFIDVFPSCGDESNIFGAGFHLYNKHVEKKVACLKKYTLGPTPSKDLVQSLTKYQDLISYQMVEDPNSYISDQLLDNKIVARCTGEMEFGARALGNRSILADPRDLNNVNKINRAIKLRDFWMPFAPAILWDHAEDFLEISGSLRNQGSPYMMFAFDTVEESRRGFMCGIHQADFTARAQTVTEERYPDLYSIIKRFYESTGVPGVLNTSFNLHGFPIVHTSDQAIAVLLDSAIDVLVIDNCAIKRAPSTVETDC